MSEPRWSPQQEAALKAVSRWLSDPGRPVFRLFGYAGTGKTTLAREIASAVDGKVAFAAFTGKAALVLQSKGCTGASTLHSLIYKLEDENAGAPKFVLNRDSAVKNADLVIVDEVSMVDEALGKDLLAFGTKVLVLGDPAQLPPVKGGGFFTRDEPDVMLTEVHRQARDNPLIRLSMDVREGGGLIPGTYGDSRVISRRELESEDVLEADQVLVGLNRTRHLYNGRLRALKSYEGTVPNVGERLVCLRNNRSKGLLNGGIWSVAEVISADERVVQLHIDPEDAGTARKRRRVSVHPHFFAGREGELSWDILRHFDELTYGYALTVHKAQGSQWDRVMLFDESHAFREDRARWLYTGLTRAARSVTVVV
ncbi:AAA family ATPase [Pseudoxanthobacter sp.]|uniref:ATP-dependent DNA helicase n=1 Tax=Pseudoxanthobacter sp. TaxID=1925742 RepID=UPI002FE296A6